MTSMIAMRRWLSAVVRDALNAGRGDINCGGITRCDVIDDLIQAEHSMRFRAAIFIRAASAVFCPDPLVGFARIIQPQVVVDRFRSQDRRQSIGQRLQPIQRPVPADANQSLNPKILKPQRDGVQFFRFLRIDVISRGTDERSAFGRVQLGNFLKERVEMDMRLLSCGLKGAS